MLGVVWAQVEDFVVQPGEDGSENMLKAQEIIRRLQGHRRPDGSWGRDLYPYVGDALIPPDRYSSYAPRPGIVTWGHHMGVTWVTGPCMHVTCSGTLWQDLYPYAGDALVPPDLLRCSS
jgi:hypothetical protein